MGSDEFTAYMCEEFQVRGFVAGSDFRYGFRRKGSTETLTAYGRKHRVFVHVVPAVSHDDQRISSTAIRASVQQGALAEVAEMLGRPYRCRGVVVRGDGRGRSLGIPTANIAEIDNLIPGTGVYAAMATTAGGQRAAAAVNIGTLPTIAEGREPSIEAHLIDFSADLYGKPLSISFVTKVRDEQRFASLDALTAQIHRDIIDVKYILDELAHHV